MFSKSNLFFFSGQCIHPLNRPWKGRWALFVAVSRRAPVLLNDASLGCCCYLRFRCDWLWGFLGQMHQPWIHVVLGWTDSS